MTRAFHRGLIAVIDQRVAGAVVAGHLEPQDRVGKLVPLAAERPLLRERRRPVATDAQPAEDVLKDTALLIERFLDEEGIVGDPEWLCRRGRLRVGDDRRQQVHEETHGTTHHSSF